MTEGRDLTAVQMDTATALHLKLSTLQKDTEACDLERQTTRASSNPVG